MLSPSTATPAPAPERTHRPPAELRSRPLPLPADRELRRIHLELVHEAALATALVRR